MSDYNLTEIQDQVDRWIRQTGKGYFSELTNMAVLTEEVGELARIISRKYGDQSYKESDKKYELADELADILWVVCTLANQTGVDLNDAFKANLEKKNIRDADRHKKSVDLKSAPEDSSDDDDVSNDRASDWEDDYRRARRERSEEWYND
jgi:NTP pyrophosphatase (non-canonical NTP hydrolase)